MASSALGVALSAVDKLAGRKTRDQLENQVGNLAQSESPLPFDQMSFSFIAQPLIWFALLICSWNQAFQQVNEIGAAFDLVARDRARYDS